MKVRLPHPFLAAVSLALPIALGAGPTSLPEVSAFRPDPASVRRDGPAYKYPQNGWTVLHIEGSPYDRGFQHGRLMGREIESYIEMLGRYRSPESPTTAWRELRNLANALFLRKYRGEYLEEMKGIADGAAAEGIKVDGRPIDLLDVVTLNSDVELTFLDEALEATETGLEGRRFREPAEGVVHPPPEGHCSAFAAMGPATADGHAIIGHITMWNLYHARHFRVWLDVVPTEGHRVLMQTYPGGIMSGMDYYLNDAGMVVCETTLDQTSFEIEGTPLCSRIREALQYGDSIDEIVETLSEGNNGLYSNEWLIADMKTDEIAMFELGTNRSCLWRSGRDEWFGGTKGFYWGCNNAKDLRVRLETSPGLGGKPALAVFRPSDRDRAWLKLFDRSGGKIDASFGFEAFTTPPLCAWPALDAKFTTAEMAGKLETFAVFGPPRGNVWEPTQAEWKRYPDTGPLVPNDWTILSTTPPPSATATACDLVGIPLKRPEPPDQKRPSAWRGTILPESDAEVWLSTAFAEYERIVALERSLIRDGKLDREGRRRLSLALFEPASRYLVARQRVGDVAMSELHPDVRSDAWYDYASGKGVLALAELRRRLTPEVFDRVMDDFGSEHAGKTATTAGFLDSVGQASEGSARVLQHLLETAAIPDEADARSRSDTARIWAVDTFTRELSEALIVYGTGGDARANEHAAVRLQGLLRRRWSNQDVPIKADRDVSPSERSGRHLILIGRPTTNSVAADLVDAWPVEFGAASFEVEGRHYAHPASALIVAGPNPSDRRYSAVLLAGLGAEATWRLIESTPSALMPAELVTMEAGGEPVGRVIAPTRVEGPPLESE